MNFLLNHLLLTYVLGVVVVGFGTLITAAFWAEGKGSEAENNVLPISIPAGLLWPVGLVGLLCFWGWQMIRVLERFYDYAFPEPPAPTNGCNHARVRGACYCPHCGRKMARRGMFSRSVVHGE
jgi:hypothetical protein